MGGRGVWGVGDRTAGLLVVGSPLRGMEPQWSFAGGDRVKGEFMLPGSLGKMSWIVEIDMLAKRSCIN